MRKFRILLTTAVMAIGLTLGLAGMASAAQQGGCGWCHGVYQNKFTYGINTTIDLRSARGGNLAAPYESSTVPQADNDRGLHGIHMNYSSASYGAGSTSTNTIDGVVYKRRGSCALCHDDSHPNHEGGFLQWSSTSVPKVNIKVTTKGFMRYSSNQGGVSHDLAGNALKNKISSFNASPRTGSCTAACHKGTSSANPAPWGNYTTASIKLTCNSCHGDASNDGGAGAGYGLSAPSNKGHKVHLTGSWLNNGGINVVIGGTTVGTMKMGAANGNTNAVCALCHPDNTGEGKTTKDWGPGRFGSSKAYPHATDGTNVLSANATVGGAGNVVLSNRTGLNMNPSCTSSCHTNKSSYQTADPNWSDTWTAGTGSHCDMCHNHQFSAGVNNSSTRPLSFAHSLHFAQLSSATYHTTSACSYDCHKVTGGLHTNYAGVVNLVQIPVLDGTAGLGAFLNNSGAGYSAAGTISVSGTCTNRCHSFGSPAWNTISTGSVTSVAGCAACHEYPSTNATLAVSSGNPVQPGKDWANTNGHSTRYNNFTSHNPAKVGDGSLKHLAVATQYNATTDTYAGVTGDQAKCGKCHSGGTHMSGSIDVNPGTGAASGFSLVNRTQGSATQCANAKCHFNRTTPNWY